MSEMASRGEKELCVLIVSTSGAELSKAVGSIGPTTHEGVKGKGFGGDTGKDIKRVSGNDVREVRDNGDAVPGIRSLIRRGVNGWGGMRKSRGRVRT